MNFGNGPGAEWRLSVYAKHERTVIFLRGKCFNLARDRHLIVVPAPVSTGYPCHILSTAMPIEKEDRMKALLAEGRITAVTLDTNIFDAQRLNLNSPALKAFISLKELPFQFLLSNTVLREVNRHLVKFMEDSLRTVKKAAGDALLAFDTAKPTRHEFLDQITGSKPPADAAAARLAVFVEDSGCEVLDDSSLVDVATLFGAYFDGLPPFSHGKKAEFPDALALYALDREAAHRQTGFLVVSEDTDWRAFCENSQLLYWVPKVEKALSLINNAPIGLRKAVVSWFADDQGGRTEVGAAITNLIEGLDVEVTADASSGEVETDAWGAETRSIDWPDEKDIDIIETEELGEGHFKAVVSLPVLITVRTLVELSFSVWDSVDKESVGMGGRSIEVDRDEEVQITVTIDFHSTRETNEEIELLDTELDIKSLDIDLGEVDVFEPDDFDYD